MGKEQFLANTCYIIKMQFTHQEEFYFFKIN